MGVKEKRLIESVLFSTSEPISINQIKETTGLSSNKIKTSLEELIEDYNITRKNETSMEVIKAGEKYIMQVKKQYADQTIQVTRPEIESTLLKTLTLIAFHQPLKQSNLRRMIGQKVYEHVDQLADLKLINTRKHGSTEMLTTTKLFPEYFGIESSEPEEIKSFLIKKVAGKLKDKELA
ncbi:MAG: SMC-Scp complex subunit ScpB [Thermoplasmatales archaeon]|jgi:segregation and condensation protein B|nr:MAG: SMC-Scp complex subunit ScpB [Thermoplasmatales archaeon]